MFDISRQLVAEYEGFVKDIYLDDLCCRPHLMFYSPMT